MQKIVELQIRYKLSPAMAKIVLLMIEHRTVSQRMIEEEHQITTDCKVLIHRIRQRFKPHNITVHSRRLVGYWLDDDVREQLNKEISNTR